MIPFGWHRWRGESGTAYRFKITLTRSGIPETGGVYVFVKRWFFFFLQPLYVGKATNFRERLLGHEKWGDAFWLNGATERHLVTIPDAREREVVEEDLIRGLKPPMNAMMMPRGKSDRPVHKELRSGWWFWRSWWRYAFSGR
jgi:hypothetical protein